MLKKIKSIFFIRIIFSYIDEKRKLDTIKYNKNLQTLINVNIINYKILSQKIIIKEITEEKEIWKIYNSMNNNLIFEGEYLNGIGKEYNDDGKVLYEGEYLNGKRNGKGKIYYTDGKLLFEGEFLNNKKWNIKEYDKNGNIINELKNGKGYMNLYNKFDMKRFEGEYINGLRNGKGKEFDDNGILIFEGEYINGLRNGKGKQFDSDGRITVEGEYLNDFCWNVKEYDKNNNIINSLKEGKGYIKEYNKSNILSFECELINGLRNGKGKEYYENGSLMFEGEYLDGEKTGKG